MFILILQMDAHIEKADYTETINVFEVMQDNDVYT